MKKLLFALAIPLLFTACDPKESYQVSTTETIVSNVVMPDTITLGDTAAITMTYAIFNDCGVYVGTEASKNGNNILIRPLVKYTFTGNNPCPENITYGEETVKLTPETEGKYLLYFKKDNSNTYKADTLIVK